MTYKFTIEAETLSELGGKAIAFAAQFSGAPAVDPVMPEVKEAVRRGRPAATKVEPVGDGAALESAAHPASENGELLPADINEAALETAEIELAIPDKETDAEAYQAWFMANVGKRVTTLASKKGGGRPAVEAVLAKFNIPKASAVTADDLPALIEALDEAIAS